jgi:DMSO/TMAO reductase YedYZ molybdopterin-dependent catalytic subunit
MEPLSRSNRVRLGFAAGVGAALVMLLAMALLRLVSGVPSMAEILADGLLLLLPGAAFSALLDALQRAAKPLLYAGIAIGALVVGGGLGRWYAGKPSARRAGSIVLGAWLVFGVGVYSVAGAGAFGQRLAAGPLWHGATLLGVFAAYGLSLWRLYDALEQRAQARLAGAAPASGVAWDRRSALQTIGGVLLGSVLVGGLWRTLTTRAGSQASDAQPTAAAAATPAVLAGQTRPNDPPWNIPHLSREVTPTRDFYTVSKNFIDPVVSASGWKLTIDGMVDHPLEFTFDQLRALPASENFYTLMCISNEVGGDLWGNAVWKGVKLRSLLEQAGVQPGVVKAVFTAADDYKDSVPIERALHPEALLAWEMNGAALGKEHGFPARLLIPGIYGMKNVKWLTGITLVSEDFHGYWQQRGWDDAAPYQTASRIDAPEDRAAVPAGALTVAGVAFAGDRGIQSVEVSADNGQTWQAAQVKPGLSGNTWQLWQVQLNVDRNVKALKVRATDGQGHLQTHEEAPPFPAGSTGYHTVDIAIT